MITLYSIIGKITVVFDCGCKYELVWDYQMDEFIDITEDLYGHFTNTCDKHSNIEKLNDIELLEYILEQVNAQHERDLFEHHDVFHMHEPVEKFVI